MRTTQQSYGDAKDLIQFTVIGPKPHDAILEQAKKFVAGWKDIEQLFDEANVAEQRSCSSSSS